MINENKLTLCRCEEVPEAQQQSCHPELPEAGQNSEDCIISSCHPEFISGSCGSDNGKILNRVQNDRMPEVQHLYRHSEDEVRRILSKIKRFFALRNAINLNSKSNLLRMTYSRHSEDEVRRILFIITRSFASLRMTKWLSHDNIGLIKNYQ